MRTHEEIRVLRAPANIVVTLMQPETATLIAKRVQNAKIVSPPVNQTAISLNLKERSPGNISE